MLAAQTGPAAPQITTGQNPAVLFETLTLFQRSMALKGALELDLFTHIAAGAATPDKLALACGASERGVRILCDFLTIIGFLSKSGSRYSLHPQVAPFVDKGSPLYTGSIAQFLTHPARVAPFRDMAAVVRKGGTIDDGLGANDQTWVDFARSMRSLVMPAALQVAAMVSPAGEHQKVLDIAAGHGMFGISIARRNPAAEIYPLDAQAVLRVAAEYAAEAGVAGRLHPIVGDVFQVDLGSNYDLVLLPNFLHHFDADTNVALLKRVHAALRPGGVLATVEFVPNEDRVSPPIAASFSLVMLANTAHGDAYTFGEFSRMFGEAGFGDSRIQPLPPTPLSLILTTRS